MHFIIVIVIFFFLATGPVYSNTSPIKPAYTNSLIDETSPYLLQHAHNPVNWFAWTKKAFDLAKKNNKVVFLSIGYSTCHWCHVMEKESFENLEIAKILNQHFIAIKVDREQRPDIDALYMSAAMLLNGQGGWPLNVFITPEGNFFYGASYFPPDKFKQILLKINSLWKNDQKRILTLAKNITQMVKAQTESQSPSSSLSKNISTQETKQAIQSFLKRFDVMQGGFSGAPKFPNEAILFFLVDSLFRNNDPEVFNAVKTTLDAMAKGGIYDHVGGGFHRYAIDNSWFTPHFEKMLYNQAHLARLYMQFYQLSGNKEYAEIARQIIDYVLLDMKASDKFGGFYSASDADSKITKDSGAEEGVFFLWGANELKEILSAEEFQFLQTLYGISAKGNFPEAGKGQNILFRYETLADYAQGKEIRLADVIKQVNVIRKKLYQIRNKRISPAIDKKIVTSWNAMMITTLLQASIIFDNKNYLDEAINTAYTINNSNFSHSGSAKESSQLLRNSINGKANILASQDDYAYFIQALIALYDRTNNKKWLIQAEDLMEQMVSLFWDKQNAGFYQDNPLQDVPVSNRLKNIYDSAIPSGNSIAYEVLTQLINRESDQRLVIKYQQLKDQMAALYAAKIDRLVAMPYMLMAVQKDLQGETNLVQYAANGNLKASLKQLENKITNQISLQLNIQLKNNWHINSSTPIQKNLIKTQIHLAQQEDKTDLKLTNILYPKAEIKKLGFSRTKLSLYEDKIKINFN
ncbi:MAG: thioredoxin domain-containing protein, partial [Pseudomonadota bacterium]